MNENPDPEVKVDADPAQRLRSALGDVIFGSILCYVEINLGFLSLIWLGYAITLSGFSELKNEVPDIELIRPLGKAIAWWSVFKSVLSLLGLGTNLWAVTVIFSVLALYFHFQLLTNLADFAQKRGWPHSRKLLQLRSVRTVLMTLTTLPVLTPLWDSNATLEKIVFAVHIGLLVWVAVLLARLRNHIAPGTKPPPSPPEPSLDELVPGTRWH